jgi:hypothetical protein
MRIGTITHRLDGWRHEVSAVFLVKLSLELLLTFCSTVRLLTTSELTLKMVRGTGALVLAAD